MNELTQWPIRAPSQIIEQDKNYSFMALNQIHQTVQSEVASPLHTEQQINKPTGLTNSKLPRPAAQAIAHHMYS